MGLFDKILGKKKEINETEKQSENNEFLAVATGKLLPIEASDDPVFAQKMMGDGYLLEPTDNTIVSPVNGEITTIFPTLHAIGITSDVGDEIIIHVGLDTVKLNGEGFTAFVKQGDHVNAGDKLLEVDFATIKDQVPSIATPVVITNIGNRTVTLAQTETVNAGDVAMSVTE